RAPLGLRPPRAMRAPAPGAVVAGACVTRQNASKNAESEQMGRCCKDPLLTGICEEGCLWAAAGVGVPQGAKAGVAVSSLRSAGSCLDVPLGRGEDADDRRELARAGALEVGHEALDDRVLL